MGERCLCRLLVVGELSTLQRFQRSKWIEQIGAKFVEPLEWSPGRFASQFETNSPPTKKMKAISLTHPKLAFLLDYEIEEKRVKGLAKVISGQSEHFTVNY